MLGTVKTYLRDAFGNLCVTLKTKLAGEDTSIDRMLTAGKYQYVNFSAATAGLAVTNETGLLGRVNVNTASAGSFKIYNAVDASDPATLVADIDTSIVRCHTYDADLSTAIFVVVTGTANTTLTYIPGV
jgi:hypothetical protein